MLLVEGYTDVLSMHQSGVENVVASSGTSLTIEQIRLVKRFTKNLTMIYDGDAAGIKASLRGIDMILAEEMNVKVCLLPDGDDPDSFARKTAVELDGPGSYADLSGLVDTMNAMGLTTEQIISMFEELRAAGAINAELISQ